MKEDLSLLNYSLIRPITLARYGYIKNRHIDRDDLDILRLANVFVKKGINYGVRGDLLFILVLYINNLEMNKLPKNYDYFGLGEADSCEQSVDNIMKYIIKMRDGEVLFDYKNKDFDLSIGDLIGVIKAPGFDNKAYFSYTEAKCYEDTYLDRYLQLYSIIYEFEKRILLSKGESVKQILKVDENAQLYEEDSKPNSSRDLNYKNSKLVVYSNSCNKMIAILLAQKHQCPFVYTSNKELYSDKFDIIDAEMSING